MVHFVFLALFVLVGCTQNKAPSEWSEWVQKKEANFQEKFSSPSIVHHVYLEKEGEEVYLQESGDGYRWTRSECTDCEFKVILGKELKVSLKDKDGKVISELEASKETQVGDNKNLFVSAHPYPDEKKVRVFIYDLGQNNLEKKRKRAFYPYQPKEVVNGQFLWLKNQEVVTISRSDGSAKEMKIVAQINFTDGAKLGSLSIYDYGVKDDSYKKEQKVMLLYRDFSNGKTTYGAGRFLVVDFKKELGAMRDGDPVLVDFNFSYNPPCAVSTGFHCPLPQDMISREVLAGEKYKTK